MLDDRVLRRLSHDTLCDQTMGGTRLTQSGGDLRFWEYLLEETRHLRALVEIGTWEGGMSRYLLMQADSRGLRFVTYDVNLPPRPMPRGFVRCDVLADVGCVKARLAGLSPYVLLCDGGDKPAELATFGASLGKDDVIVVHDWDDEVSIADVPDGLVPYLADEAASCTGCHTRAFMRGR